MRTDIDHLPPAKQRELERVVQILFEEFEEATVLATQDWKKKGRILKIILYGSYARGSWVDEPHTAKGYQSDFDLLVVVSDKRLSDRVEYWAKAGSASFASWRSRRPCARRSTSSSTPSRR
jgi:predicted nucleotidyltransferase